MVAETILGFLLKPVAQSVQSKGMALLKKRAAARELAEIGERAVAAAADIAPDLTPDLQSKSFLEGVVGPMLQTVVQRPATILTSDRASSEFIEMFVAAFARNESVDETLTRVFKTDRVQLEAAFDAMLADLRKGLFASTHWRAIALYQSTEEMRSDVAFIRDTIEELAAIRPPAPVDVEAARRDAHVGSSELREWPKDIEGEEIYRPELDRLLAHLEAHEEGTSLLIGDAGSGKSALLADLTAKLEQQAVVVFAVKADVIPASVATIDDIGRAMGMSGSLADEIEALSRSGRVILLIDQLDAVSEVMDPSSSRMRLLLRLVRQLRDKQLPIHVLVSSRPFEAAHDARFAQLKAEKFTLELPPHERVIVLLEALGIDGQGIDPAMLETIRRPFALKLFVDLARRGVDVKSILPGELLDMWLQSANLGSDSERSEVLVLLERIAAEMIATETLWRPVDRFSSAARALARAEASGLIVRSGDKIGFSHQSWLDDFQAKGFHTGKDLAEYAWENQDGLFVRATVLRSLQRLRARDEKAHASAVKALLFDARTRRHLKHLIVDIVTAQDEPLTSEVAWAETLLRTDSVLSNRALGNIASRWGGWREGLRWLLPQLMANPEYHWRSIQLLAAEASHDPDGVADLINRLWGDPDQDDAAFRVLEQAGVLTPKIEAILETVLGRSPVDHYGVSHLVTTLVAEGRHADASRLVALWARSLKTARSSSPQFHRVGELATKAPLEFAQAMLPWFVGVAELEVQSYRDGVARYPESRSLPWDWDFERGEDSLIQAIRTALNLAAVARPSATLALLEPLFETEIEQVQELIAEALAAGGEALAGDAFRFIMGDERRLQIGDASVTIEPGLSGSVAGLASQELIGAIVLFLSDERIEALRDRIERWSLYGPEFGKEADADFRRRKYQYIDQERLPLLERFPQEKLSSRRRRQIAEWRKHNRKPMSRTTGGAMAAFVGSPMSAQAMVKGSDDAILKMLDELNDDTPRQRMKRPLAMGGGVIELSRAFAAFGNEQPDRALAIASTRLVPGQHEHAAGTLVHTLARESDVAPERLLQLIYVLSAKGFDSKSWRQDASWALATIAPKIGGLDDLAVELLVGWLDTDPEHVAEQIKARLDNKAANAERNKSRNKRELAEPLLFDRNRGGRSLPHNNYTILGAIFQALMNREEKGFDRWLSILEQHAGKPEDPEVWSHIFMFEGRWLFWADRPRVIALLDRLFAGDPSIFDDVDTLPIIWSTRAMFSDALIEKIILRWLASSDVQTRQGAAEFIQAGRLIEPENPLFRRLEGHFGGDVPELLTGRLFSAAVAWRDEDLKLRQGAHPILIAHALSAKSDAAYAISAAVSRTDRLLADPLTIELIEAIGDNSDLLSKSLNGRFAEGLQGLLLYPGFDETVLDLAAKVAELITAEQGGQYRGLADEDFVQVTVALQRSDGPLRARAMDIYERFLDAGAYGAEQAAKDACGR